MRCAVSLLEISQVVLKKKDFENRQCNSTISRSLSFKQIWIFFSTKDALYQVWLIMAFWLRRNRLLNVVNVYSICLYYLPLGMSLALHLIRLEFPLSMYFALSLVETGPVALEKILKCRHCVFSMSIHVLSPLGEERGPSSNLNFLLPKMFCTSLIETGPVVLKMKM